MSATTPPTSAQIAHFLTVFHRLDAFEAQQYAIRGYGAFDRSLAPLPDHDVVAVMAWLRDLA